MLTSFMGAWLAIVCAGVAAVVIIMGIVGSAVSGSMETVEKNSVMRVSLDGTIVERESMSELNLMTLLNKDFSQVQSVETLTAAIRAAASDDRVKCIYLDCGFVQAAPASLNAVRGALTEFRKSGKKIYAYADQLTQGAYFVASAADEISLNPAGEVMLNGLGGQSLFFKGLFDKVGVQFQAVRVGKGKAAVEPYTQDTMSSVARQQNMQLIDTLWLQIRRQIAADRKDVTPAKIDTLINRDFISAKPAQYALAQKIVDKLEYRHAFEDRIAKAAGQEDGLEKEVSASAMAMYDDKFSANTNAGNQIAVLYACGAIDDMMGGGGIDSEVLTEQILDLADDDNVKALVLRVNSPGGSAFGSEQMWEALETFKKTGKKFVVSMGDYAASGGYYISCGADRIFADEYTVTGSIGIFGLIPNCKGLLDMAGVNVETVATNPAGVYGTGLTPLDEQQLAAMQSMVENGYELFVSRVAAGRKMTAEKVKTIADGRPLSAVVAKDFGLVDQLGSLGDAIDWASRAGKIENPELVAYPQVEMNFMAFMGNMQNSLLMKLINTDNPKQAVQDILSAVQVEYGSGKVMASMPPFRVGF